MRIRDLLRLSSLRRIVVLLFAPPILILTFAAAAFAQTPVAPAAPTSPPPTAQPPSAQTLKNWRDGMAHVPPPTAGCFTSSYPNTQWQEVPCQAPPAHPFLPARGPRPSTVGGGNDVVTGVTTGHISLAVGSFDSVTGVTSITSQQGSNDYSLQLNTNTFSSPVCSGAGTPSKCVGWQQFIYSQAQCSSGSQSSVPCVFIQYWLLGWGSTTCPSGGWTFYLNGTDDECYRNSNIVVPPQAQPISGLGNLAVVAEATSGGLDAVIVSTGSSLYAVQNNDNVLSLGGGWTSLEYNLVGDCCGSAATFNSGSAMVVRTSVENGSPSPPSCLSSFSGFTAETNSLNFASAPAAIRGTTPAIMFTQSSSGSASSACSSATAVASGALVDSHDFNADGKSDIAWRDTSGNNAMWLMNGATVAQSTGLGNIATAWSIVGQRDFNGDGKADLLWQDTSGDLAIWFMSSATVMSGVGLGKVSGWSIVGTGDFNGDGYGDILWRNPSTGAIAMWLMNGSSIVSSAGLGSLSTAWTVVGTGDFNGDGKTDILWQDTSGDIAIWFMNGTTVSSGVGLGTIAPPWTIVATGDFNGDGYEDILWRNTSTGAIAVWLMNGSTISSSAGLGSIATTWSVVETGDFNGDGKTDILWHDTSGDVAIWFMNGTTVSSGVGLGTIATSWSIQGAGAD